MRGLPETKPTENDCVVVKAQTVDEVTVQMVDVTMREESHVAVNSVMMTTTTSTTSAAAAGPSTVELAATADEARRRMSKKKDVRTTSGLSMKDKYDLFKRM